MFNQKRTIEFILSKDSRNQQVRDLICYIVFEHGYRGQSLPENLEKQFTPQAIELINDIYYDTLVKIFGHEHRDDFYFNFYIKETKNSWQIVTQDKQKIIRDEHKLFMMGFNKSMTFKEAKEHLSILECYKWIKWVLCDLRGKTLPVPLSS